MTEARRQRRIRVWLVLFTIGLVLSGVTAFPLVWEVQLLHVWLHAPWLVPLVPEAVMAWIDLVHRGVTQSDAQYPFLAYGTDWLAFAHLVIAVAFLGPLRDPVRNRWVVEFGMIACVLVIPLALIMGPIRGIPFWWRLIDCSFGVVGIIPLWLVWRDIRALEQEGAGGVGKWRDDSGIQKERTV